jgi:hypothetical protein
MTRDTKGYLEGLTMLVETTDGRKKLLQKIRVTCDRCEPVTVILAGHHIRALRQMCDDLITAFPDLTGEEPFDPKVN